MSTEYTTFIIAVDVPTGLLEGVDVYNQNHDHEPIVYGMIEAQVREQNGFHVVGSLPPRNIS